MKGTHDEEETKRLRQELEQLKSQVAALVQPQLEPQSAGSVVSHTSPSASLSATIDATIDLGLSGSETPTKHRNVGDIDLTPWQIDTAFDTFFSNMHPFLPFLAETTPSACYETEPFLFWVICVLGLRSTYPDLSKRLQSHVSQEALQAPMRTCHNQAAALSVVQGLLLLAVWPFSCPSLLHEASWMHCGTATHLAMHIGLHHPYAASEFVPQSGRDHIPNLFIEFRRTWIATYIINVFISFARGYPATVRADFNVISYTLSNPEELSILPDLFKSLLIARRMEEGQDLGHSRTGEHGHIDPGSREGIYRLLQSRISDTETRSLPLSPYIGMIIMAAKLQPAVQILQYTTPVSLQETTILAACENAAQVINLARVVQKQTNMVQLPVIVDALVLMSTVMIFKIQISRFSSFVNAELAQSRISEACNYFREGVNEFNDIPARVSIFVEALYTLVVENLVPVGGFVIENTKCRYSQNILYEVSIRPSAGIILADTLLGTLDF